MTVLEDDDPGTVRDPGTHSGPLGEGDSVLLRRGRGGPLRPEVFGRPGHGTKRTLSTVDPVRLLNRSLWVTESSSRPELGVEGLTYRPEKDSEGRVISTTRWVS